MYCQLKGCRKHHSDLIVNDYKQEVHHQYIANLRCRKHHSDRIVYGHKREVHHQYIAN